MIKKTILVFIVLFGIYSLVVVLNPGMSAPQHQWQENVVKGEKYIYNTKESVNSVIVGSSLACRIIMDSLPSCYNLSFAGQGIFDGLDIIKRTGKYPKNIFVEMNAILTDENKTFTADLFSPFPFAVKKHIVSLRSDKQPLAFIFPAIQSILHKKDLSKTTNEEVKNTVIFDKMLSIEVGDYSKLPDTTVVNKNFLTLIDYVNYFKKNGVKIVFFEMPINPSLTQLPLAKFIRAEFYKRFPAEEYIYINIPDNSNYKTTDGLHLTDKESLWYTTYFKESLKVNSLD